MQLGKFVGISVTLADSSEDTTDRNSVQTWQLCKLWQTLFLPVGTAGAITKIVLLLQEETGGPFRTQGQKLFVTWGCVSQASLILTVSSGGRHLPQSANQKPAQVFWQQSG